MDHQEHSSNGECQYDSEGNSMVRNEQDDQFQADKAGEYVRELLQEKTKIDNEKYPNATRLIDLEIQKTQAIGKPLRDPKYVDIYREKPIRVAVKVLVPVKEHPKFNFVGKLLGPKGNSMKRLQEETMCKMAVLGRGSMKDKQKEEEYRQSLDPKYAHLSDDLHVEIIALATPAEAHARIAFALAEVRKYLIPDNNDNIRQEQMREMELTVGSEHSLVDERRSGGGPHRSSGILRSSGSRPPLPPSGGMSRSSRAILPPPPSHRSAPPSISRSAPPKTKVYSILDRARVSIDQSYNDEVYDSHPPSSSRYHSSASSYDYDDDSGPGHDYYDSPDYSGHQSMKYADESSSRSWKSYKTSSTSGSNPRYRSSPYSRHPK